MIGRKEASIGAATLRPENELKNVVKVSKYTYVVFVLCRSI